VAAGDLGGLPAAAHEGPAGEGQEGHLFAHLRLAGFRDGQGLDPVVLGLGDGLVLGGSILESVEVLAAIQLQGFWLLPWWWDCLPLDTSAFPGRTTQFALGARWRNAQCRRSTPTTGARPTVSRSAWGVDPLRHQRDRRLRDGGRLGPDLR
jgi:hypothetical protein